MTTLWAQKNKHDGGLRDSYGRTGNGNEVGLECIIQL
jgi:hypothetical protein